MNREIKFRAWDEMKKVMHNDFEFIRSGVDVNDWIIFKSDKQPLNSMPHPLENPYFSQQLKIMQFTGIKDKNGREIYERDIVKLSEWEPSLCEIIFYEGSFCFRFLKDNYRYYTDLKYIENGVVIDNIYENQDLLK